MAADADRNLLFGILAVQMDFVTRDDLIGAMSAWALQKHKPLDRVLVERGALSEPRRALLEPLVREHVRAHGDDAARSLAALSSAESIRRDLGRVADPDVQASLAAASAARAGDAGDGETYATAADAADATAAGGADSWNPRFRILRPHAKGGLGEVFVARDVELNRQVALKEIQHKHADQPTSRARFLLEAEITGALEHPGIVPVYGLGHYPDGRPFYAMRFVKGDNLADAIRRFHAAEGAGRDPSRRALGFRTLLGRFVDVCNAVAYAHSKGVLHRDLKPANVMLGRYGETLVVDWGLAKAIGRADPGLHPDEEPVTLSSGGSGVESLPGKALGTPQFMSPEQAAGELDRLGPQSDVYSLGATLYTVLTGRPAFEDRDTGAVLQKVIKGEFPPPRRVDARVPRALEAVCLKAMAPKPEARYATPRALAEDVERWLADEPVSAWREPFLTRARRWVGRHRTAVTAAAAAALVAATAVGYVAYDARLRRARESTRRLTAAIGRVESLARAEVRALPEILRELGEDRGLVRDQLGQMARGDGSGADGRRRLPGALALLPEDPTQADFLAERLLSPEAMPDEVLVIREALIAHPPTDGAVPRFRRALPAKAADLDDAQLRAAGALAKLAPADPLLSASAAAIARKLVRENPLLIGAWREVFQPIAGRLAGPLRRAYADPAAAESRSHAFTLLFEFATRPDNQRQPEDLVALVGDADPDQFRQVLGRLATPAGRDRAVALLTPKVREPARFDDELARRQCRWALALLRLGRAEAVWPLLRHRDDPSLRTELIHNAARFGLDPAPVVERLRVERDVSSRRALILCLGEFPPEAISESDRRDLAERFLARYAADPDPGVHGGLDWLLRRWGRAADLQASDRRLAREAPPKGRDWYVNGQVPFTAAGHAAPEGRDWYVNGQGQTYTIVRGPVEFAMGSPAAEAARQPNEVLHRVRIGRTFAIAAREVTFAQYARFLDQHPELLRIDKLDEVKSYITSDDCPVFAVDWYDCARYCNWLSAREGIPEDQWCYPKDIPAQIKPGDRLMLPPDYLGRTGYRLPTEAEWEYACRAGTATRWPSGGSEQWLPSYAWYLRNSGQKLHPAGRLKPNDLGLFDVAGNVGEWLQDPYEKYGAGVGGTPLADAEMAAPVSYGVFRGLRGGTFNSSAPLLRSAFRLGDRPTNRAFGIGFRTARTYP
jgi:formylglycine-generating enzyme required for sulfatase activity/tRNA A-37 threonylcarbamoyl transferase component Bud32